MTTVKDNIRGSRQWRPRKGSPTQVKDNTPINHVGNRSFENIRDHQLSSIFTLQKHLADCSKGPRERKSTPEPLRTDTGEFSPCQTEMSLIQNDDGGWCYEYSELPGLVPMSYGMKTFDIIEQIPFSTPPTPDYRPRGDEMPKDRPKDNDPRFCYHSNVKLWKTTQVVEERSLRVASDKVRLWLDAVQNTCPDIKAEFPPSQAEANQATAAAKASGKGGRKRQSSVPHGSDTAKAKQARSMDEEKGKKGGKGEREDTLHSQASAGSYCSGISRQNQ